MRLAGAALLVLLPLAGCFGGDAPVGRDDTTSIPVLAGRSVEFKLSIKEGAVLDYSWTSPSPLRYDFHGDRDGDKSGAFTSHKAGTAAKDSGQLKAPFDGRHGWYWENRGSAAVSIDLHTKGTYQVIGLVA